MQPGTASMPLADLLEQFLLVQQQRAEHYASFHAAFKANLAAKSEVGMRQGVQTTSAAFGSCSQKVRQLETTLKDVYGRNDLADLLRSIQEHEREKLRLTLALQSLRTAHALESFTWQQEEDVDLLEAKVPRTCGCGSGPHSAPDGPGHAHHASGPQAHAEPTKAEYQLAVQEAQLALDGHVQGINETIEEVRDVLADLLE